MPRHLHLICLLWLLFLYLIVLLFLSFKLDGIEIEDFLEFKPLIWLDHLPKINIVIVPAKLYLQHWGQLGEPYEFDSILLAVLFGFSFVLVGAVQSLLSNILPKRILNGLVSFNSELYGIERFFSCRFEINIYALYHILLFPFEEMFESALYWGILHLSVQLLTQNAIELTYILLLVDLLAVPAECLQKLNSPHELLVAKLQIVEDPLEAERNGALQLLPILLNSYCWHSVNSISEGPDEGQGLNDWV